MSGSEEGEASESEDSDDEVADFRLYRGGDDAFDRILEILQEDDNDEDAEFEGFLPDYQRDPKLNFHNFEFDGHLGFDKDELDAKIEANGFELINYQIGYTINAERNGEMRDYPVFVLIAKKTS